MLIAIDARLWGIEHRGLGRYVQQLVEHSAKIDQATDFILLTNPSNLEAPTGLPHNFKIIPAPWQVYSWPEQILLPRLLNQIKPDLVFFPHFNVPLLVRQPYVVTIHDLILHHYPSSRATTLPKPVYWLKILAYRLLLRRVVTRARAIITISQATALDVKKFYPKVASKINVIPIAPSPKVEPAVLDLPEKYFLAVGAAYPHKNLEMLCEAFQSARQLHPEIKLIIVGKKDYFMNRLEQELKAKSKDDGIIFWGQADDATLATLYAKTIAYLMPSLIEGFGLGPLEAMQYGAKVVVSDLDVFREILGDSARYVDRFNAKAWAEVMFNLLDSKELGNSETKFEVLKKYNWINTAQNTLAVIKKVILAEK